MSVVIRLKVPIEMHYTVIPMGTSKVNSSPRQFGTKTFRHLGRFSRPRVFYGRSRDVHPLSVAMCVHHLGFYFFLFRRFLIAKINVALQ